MLRRDVAFLLDCLENIDPAVRVAAKAALEKAAGHGLAYDVSADASERAVAVEKLRALLKKENDAKATTQPN